MTETCMVSGASDVVKEALRRDVLFAVAQRQNLALCRQSSFRLTIFIIFDWSRLE
jgi:hypothetical protein